MEFNVDTASDYIDEVVLEAHKKALMIGLRHVIVKSPVLTGTYKASHKINGILAKGSYEKEEQIIKIKTGYRISTISNSLPYAGAIENGHSSQAPLGVYLGAWKAIKDALQK